MLNDLLFITLALLLMAGVLWTAFSSPFSRGWSGHEKRAFIHIASGSWAVIWLFISSQTVALLFTGIMVTLVGGAFFVKSRGLASKVSELSLERESYLGIFLYGISIMLVTAFLWDDKLIGSVALIALAVGDGIADIVGKRYGRRHYVLPWAPRRSLEGTASGGLATFFAVSAFLFLFGLPLGSMVFVAVVATVAESAAEALSPNHSDNLFIPAVVAGALLVLYG